MTKEEINEIIIDCCLAAQDFVISLKMVDACVEYVPTMIINAVLRRDEAALLKIREEAEEEK